MLTVREISVIGAYTLRAKLSNGIEGVFDVSPYVHKGIFTQLQDIEYFQRVRIYFCGICWPNGQDFSADTIEYDMRETALMPIITENVLQEKLIQSAADTKAHTVSDIFIKTG